MKTTVIHGGARLDRDVTVRMRDGARLFVNVFRPADDAPAPVVMSVTPYGKDTLPDWVHMTLMRLTGVRFGWAAHQPCSSGAVGLICVSYLCMSQWRVAGLRPPALRAIVPWEGVTDLLRELAYQDGVPETGSLSTWWRFRMTRGRNRRCVAIVTSAAATRAHR